MDDTVLWWLSFADSSRPKGEQFLGVVIVRGFDMMQAVLVASRLGLNPGGGIRGFQIPEDYAAEKWHGRLLTREDCQALEAEQRA